MTNSPPTDPSRASDRGTVRRWSRDERYLKWHEEAVRLLAGTAGRRSRDARSAELLAELVAEVAQLDDRDLANALVWELIIAAASNYEQDKKIRPRPLLAAFFLLGLGSESFYPRPEGLWDEIGTSINEAIRMASPRKDVDIARYDREIAHHRQSLASMTDAKPRTRDSWSGAKKALRDTAIVLLNRFLELVDDEDAMAVALAAAREKTVRRRSRQGAADHGGVLNHDILDVHVDSESPEKVAATTQDVTTMSVPDATRTGQGHKPHYLPTGTPRLARVASYAERPDELASAEHGFKKHMSVANDLPYAAPEQEVGRMASRSPRDIRLPPAHFVGRVDVLDRITTSPHQFVNIWGTPGVGKTGLAYKWVAGHVNDFPDGVVTVELNGYGAGEPLDASEVARRILRRLGVEPAEILDDEQLRFGQLTTVLGDSRPLLVLDNVAESLQVIEVLTASASARVIITSRGPLGPLQAELSVEAIGLEPLSDIESARFIAGVVGAERFERNPDVLHKLARLAAGLPIALMLVAARIVEDPGPIEVPHSLLDVDGADHPRGSIRAAFEWSYEPLNLEQRRLLIAMASVPHRYASRPLRGALVALYGEGSSANALVRRGLLTLSPDGSATLHDLVREFAVSKADEISLDPDNVAEAAVEWQLRKLRELRGVLASMARDSPVRVREIIDRFDAIWPGTQDCLAWTRRSHRALHWALTYHAGEFLQLKGDWRAYLREAEVALRAAELGNRRLWYRRLSRQMRRMRVDAMLYAELPGFGEPARASVQRIEELLGIDKYDNYWARGFPFYATARESPNDPLTRFRVKRAPEPDLAPGYEASLTETTREMLLESSHHFVSRDELAAFLSVWAAAPFRTALAQGEDADSVRAAQEAIGYFEDFLKLAGQDDFVSTELNKAVPWHQLRLSALYKVVGLSGSELDRAVVSSARDAFQSEGKLLLVYRLTRYLEDTESVDGAGTNR